MRQTRIDLPEETRAEIAALLNARLADAVDLMMQAKQAHWNVRGTSFFALHELFDKVHEEVAGYVDLVAERAVQLGHVAEGTVRTSAERSALGEYPLRISSGHDHAEALAAALGRFAELNRRAIDQAAALRDAGTADIFTEISRGTDKLLWMVEAHLHA
jgi:starvation-inducible DNA-binding protein